MRSVLVDTSVWSLALRRRVKDLSRAQRALQLELRDMIVAGNVVLIGAIRQEILTGISDKAVFERISAHLRDFDDLPVDFDDYERAAAFANECSRQGIAHSPIDMLICAVAAGSELPIFTTDDDFERYARQLPIRLWTQ